MIVHLSFHFQQMARTKEISNIEDATILISKEQFQKYKRSVEQTTVK